MVTREMIQAEKDRWSQLPEDTRGELANHIRLYLEENISQSERKIQRGSERVDIVSYILEDLDSYG